MNTNIQKSSYLTERKGGTLNRFLGLITSNERMETGYGSDESRELLECIRSAKSEWLTARSNFEYAEDEDLVDYYTYKIKACEVRYQYYLKKAKLEGLKAEKIEQLEILTQEDARNGAV